MRPCINCNREAKSDSPFCARCDQIDEIVDRAFKDELVLVTFQKTEGGDHYRAVIRLDDLTPFGDVVEHRKGVIYKVEPAKVEL